MLFRIIVPTNTVELGENIWYFEQIKDIYENKRNLEDISEIFSI